MAAIIDIHSHTHYSDGAASVEEMVSAAVERGCACYAITDHLTLPPEMDPDCEVSVPEERLGQLRSDVEEARRAHPELDLIFGFECDWYEGCEENVRRWSEGASFRFGSVHWVSGAWIDDPGDLHIWHELGPDEVWRRYVDAWCAACESELAFDSMAHPDLPQRFSKEGLAASIDLAPLWDRMADCARSCDRRVELSTAGLRKKGLQAYYPAPGLIRRFCDAGVKLTVGSDAHLPQDVAWGIEEAYRYAHSAGYRAIEVPRSDGDWYSLPIG